MTFSYKTNDSAKVTLTERSYTEGVTTTQHHLHTTRLPQKQAQGQYIAMATRLVSTATSPLPTA